MNSMWIENKCCDCNTVITRVFVCNSQLICLLFPEFDLFWDTCLLSLAGITSQVLYNDVTCFAICGLLSLPYLEKQLLSGPWFYAVRDSVFIAVCGITW